MLLVLAVVQLGRLRLPAVLTALCCAALVGYPLTSVAYNSRATIRHNNDIGRRPRGWPSRCGPRPPAWGVRWC